MSSVAGIKRRRVAESIELTFVDHEEEDTESLEGCWSSSIRLAFSPVPGLWRASSMWPGTTKRLLSVDGAKLQNTFVFWNYSLEPTLRHQSLRTWLQLRSPSGPFLTSLWELHWNLQQVHVAAGRCVFMSPVRPEESLNTFFAHSCPSTANCPWHADSVVYTNVQPSTFVPTSRIERSCASCLLPGWYFQENVCCPNSKVDCVVSCGGTQRVLLATELEHCLGYPRGHTASLVMSSDQVDLSHVELQRMDILQTAAPVLPLVTVLLSHFHVQESKRVSQLQACANPNWMVHSMCERVACRRALPTGPYVSQALGNWNHGT